MLKPPKSQRTPEGKWTIYRATDGKAFERWPVDAKPMLKAGEFTLDPPGGAPPPRAATKQDRGVVESPDASVPVDQRGAEVTATTSSHMRPISEVEASVSEEDGATDAPESWPDGYRHERSGGYFAVTAPSGDPVASSLPSGMWQGEQAAREAAWRHAGGAPDQSEATETEDAEG